jgi:hypothetical protein
MVNIPNAAQARACEWFARGERAGRARARRALTFAVRPVGELRLARAIDVEVAPARTLKRRQGRTSRRFRHTKCNGRRPPRHG